MEGSFLGFAAVVPCGDVDSHLTELFRFGEFVVVVEPVLKTAIFPLADVFGVKGRKAVRGKPLDDLCVGFAIVEQEVDLLAGGLR